MGPIDPQVHQMARLQALCHVLEAVVSVGATIPALRKRRQRLVLAL